MLLITFNEWFGPGRHASDTIPKAHQVDESITQTGFVTGMELPEALLHVHAYEIAHNNRFVATAIHFTLLSVSKIDYLDEDIREKMDIQLIEALPIIPEEID